MDHCCYVLTVNLTKFNRKPHKIPAREKCWLRRHYYSQNRTAKRERSKELPLIFIDLCVKSTFQNRFDFYIYNILSNNECDTNDYLTLHSRERESLSYMCTNTAVGAKCLWVISWTNCTMNWCCRFNDCWFLHKHMMHLSACCLHVGQYKPFITQASSIGYLSVLLCVGSSGLAVTYSICSSRCPFSVFAAFHLWNQVDLPLLLIC